MARSIGTRSSLLEGSAFHQKIVVVVCYAWLGMQHGMLPAFRFKPSLNLTLKRALQTRDRMVPSSISGRFFAQAGRSSRLETQLWASRAQMGTRKMGQTQEPGAATPYAAGAPSLRMSPLSPHRVAGSSVCPRSSRPSQSCRLRTAQAWNNWHCAAANPTRRACRQPL